MESPSPHALRLGNDDESQRRVLMPRVPQWSASALPAADAPMIAVSIRIGVLITCYWKSAARAFAAILMPEGQNLVRALVMSAHTRSIRSMKVSICASLTVSDGISLMAI